MRRHSVTTPKDALFCEVIPLFVEWPAASKNLLATTRKSHTTRLSGVLIAFLVVACHEQMPFPTVPLPNTANVSTSAGLDTFDLRRKVVNPFKLELNILGAFKPGMPLLLQGTVSSVLKSDDVEISLVTPELEILKDNNGVWPDRPTDTRVNRTNFIKVDLAVGEEARIAATVLPEQEGYYRAVLSAKLTNPTNIRANGADVINFRATEVWFVIKADGGAVTPTFSADAMGPGYVPRIGPAVRQAKRYGEAGRAYPPFASKSAALRLATGYPPVQWHFASSRLLTNPATRHYFYYDTFDQAYYPMQGIELAWKIYDDYEGRELMSGWSYTDSNGDVEAVCPGNWTSHVEGPVRFIRYGQFHVHPPNIDYVHWYSEYEGTCGQDYGMTVVPTAEGSVFRNMDRIVSTSKSGFGHNRPFINVNVSSGESISYYAYGGTESITIAADGPNAAIVGPYGLFTQSHEYGHSVHQLAWSGIHKQESCPSGGHSLDAGSNLGCAWSEGIADFHASVTESNWITAGIINNVWFASGDGSVWESAVASFIYDVSQLTGRAYMGSAISACRIDGRYDDGIDFLIYCLEQYVDANVRQSYFAYRQIPGYSVTASAGSPPNAPQSTLRAKWLWALYRQ